MTRSTLHLGATVLRVPTEAGDLFFKASAPARAFEGTLMARVAPHSAGHIPAPLAIEPEEGWALHGAPGTPISALSPARAERAWRRTFADVAQLQLAAGDADDLLEDAPAPVLVPDQVPGYLEGALLSAVQLPREHPLHVAAADADMLASGLATVEQAVQLLDAVPLPITLQQGSLSPDQVLVPGSHRAPILFVGWGEARWAHPFGLIGTAVERLCRRHQCEPDEEPVASIVAAYFDEFRDWGTREDLTQLLAPALLLSHAQRHQTLAELLADAEPEDQREHAPELMRLLAEACAATSSPSRRAARPGGSRQGGSRQGGSRTGTHSGSGTGRRSGTHRQRD